MNFPLPAGLAKAPRAFLVWLFALHIQLRRDQQNAYVRMADCASYIQPPKCLSPFLGLL